MNILSKQNSTAMKGFFILLIIFGHCSLLGADWSHGIKYHVYSWYNYLYDFHVACFFILPFLYNKNTYKKGNIKKYAARLLVPFLLFCLICFLISLLYNKPINIYILPLALLTGSEYLLKNSIGFGYLWFLPAMFTLLLIKDFYYTSCRIIKIGVVLCCVVLCCVVLLADTSIRQVSIYAPMGLAQSMKMFLLGIITRQFVDFNKIGSTVILSLVFLGVTSLYFVLIDSLNRRFLDNIFSLVLPVVFFMLVLSIKKILSKLKILLLLGKYSLQIYLIHVIIYNCFLGIILHKTHTPDKIIGGIVFMLTLAISLVIGIILTKWKFFNKYIFSKEYKNIVGKKSNQI